MQYRVLTCAWGNNPALGSCQRLRHHPCLNPHSHAYSALAVVAAERVSATHVRNGTPPFNQSRLPLLSDKKFTRCAMGDVPINPSGFAHGFRPLDGAVNPPPTPTQRNATQRDVVVPAGGFLSALSQQTPGDAPAGAMSIGMASSRKRRRLPGPLALLQQGHSG